MGKRGRNVVRGGMWIRGGVIWVTGVYNMD